jgi:hypothetical protein
MLPTLRLVIDLDDKAITAPQLDIMTIDIALGLLDGLLIFGANDGIEPDKMPVESDGVDAPRPRAPALHLARGAVQRRFTFAHRNQTPSILFNVGNRTLKVSSRDHRKDRG